MRLREIVTATAVTAVAGLISPLFAFQPAWATNETQSVILRVPVSSTNELWGKLDELGVNPEHRYSHTIHGASANLTATEIDSLRANVPGVVITQNTAVHLDTVQSSPTWGLDALDQSSPTLDNSYTYPSSGGDGVDVYVVDTGLRASTYASGGELVGRVTPGRNFATSSANSGVDPSDTRECLVNQSGQQDGGHGTHVAGTIASTTYGVAKRATVIPLRVFPCASLDSRNQLSADAQTGDVIAAIDWAVANHQKTGRPGVINMSLGGSCDSNTCASDELVLAASAATNSTVVNGNSLPGLTVVLAAGNGDGINGINACNVSPAASPSAISVGAIDASRAITRWSNFGSCVSIFAPGNNIRSLNAWQSPASSDPSPYADLSGTSMASPHVAGVAALYLGLHPRATPAQVKSAILSGAQNGFVSGLSGSRASSPNKMLSMAFTNATPVSLPQPTALSSTSTRLNRVSLSWQASTDLNQGIVDDYAVEFKKSNTSGWWTFNDEVGTSTSAIVSGLSAGTSYDFKVQSLSNTGLDPAASPPVLTLTTMSGLPTSVRSLRASTTRAKRVNLMWSSPSTTNDGVISDYYIQYRQRGASAWKRYNDGTRVATGAVVSGLSSRTTYEFRVWPRTAQGFGVPAVIARRTL